MLFQNQVLTIEVRLLRSYLSSPLSGWRRKMWKEQKRRALRKTGAEKECRVCERGRRRSLVFLEHLLKMLVVRIPFRA